MRETAGEKTTALAVALTGLEQAVNSGTPFDRELATVEALAEPYEEITALKAYAREGVASRATLREDFQDAASAAMNAGAPPSDGFVDRLISDARRIVRIRPTGDVEGDTTGAILARAETKLEAGDLAAALEELAALDDEARAAMSGWLEQARARQEAERLVAALNEEVLSGLSAGEGTDAQ
ncbi:MAG TPA: mitofilin family membrane protein [Hyphomicrobiales bacterium]|nr:mitofilin family membrane protein [Hyphomicrobiales bacterium]